MAREFNDVQFDVEFTQASSRTNLTSKENISLAFGKLSKWYEALVPTGGSSGQFLGWNSDGTAKWVSNPNTDTKVRQSILSTNTNHPLLLAYSDNTITTANIDNVSYRSNGIYANPSTGTVTATNFAGKINGHTVSIDVPSNAKFTDTVYTHPTYTSKTSGLYKITVDSTGHVSATAAVAKGDIPALDYVPNTKNGVNAAINLLDTGSSTPTDADYYISQYVGGGTTTTTYHRRPMSALWSYVKDKADSVYSPIGHTHTLSIAADSGTNQLTLSTSTKYKLTAGGSTFVFTTPPDTKNTAGSTDTSSKIFLIGATSQAANPQTYSDDQCYVTSGTLQANKVQASATVCANTANSNSAGGIALYSTDPEVYGIMFRGTSNSGKHGYVQSDWATYFTMNQGATTRGWIFRKKTDGPVASISGAGNAVFNGSVTVGGNTTNTSGCRMEYNTSTQSLDFVFV
jgi:hypothetical protein